MDEIEYKLNSKNSVLIVNAIDKLISAIKSKFKLADRQKFVVENEEFRFLREKCSSRDSLVSLTACQGLLALVQLGVLEIGHTMSTVITLLPSAHNYSAIISTMGGLLTLDLKSRLVPGQPYVCQFSLRTPQHPFITVLEKIKAAEDDVVAQMQALCTHPDYIISSNALSLLRPVVLWLTCECARPAASLRPWQLLLSLPPNAAQRRLLLACVSCQQMCNPALMERAYAAYSAVTDAMIYQLNREYVVALLPLLARLSNELITHGRDPRGCYALLERCAALDAPEVRSAVGVTVATLAANLLNTSALHLYELFNLCLNIISKYECPSLSLNMFAALSLQWLHLPSYLTSAALKVASKILETYQQNLTEDNSLHTPNLIKNKIFESLLYTDGRLTVTFKLHQIWERIRDNPDELRRFFEDLNSVSDDVKLELLPFFLGITLEKRKDVPLEEVIVKVVDILVSLVNVRKEVSVQVLPVLLYKIANDPSPNVKVACLKALPLMAKTKENVPTIVAVLNKLKANKGAPMSFLIMLYTSLAETQVRCFPYLLEMLAEGGGGGGRPDDLKWETDIARAMAVNRICEIRASTHGLELVSVISSVLNRCTGGAGGAATALALGALVRLWRGAAVAPPSTWRALEPKLGRDNRHNVQISICKLLAEVPALRVSTPEYDKLVSDTAQRLWSYVAEGSPEVVEAACDALSNYRPEDYRLAHIPQIYRRTVKLPPAYCKTPADAARRPEDVLDYIPCEVWPEVFKYTNQAALAGVRRLLTRLVEREMRGYRSGVYQPDSRGEPRDMSYLPPHSRLRGLVHCTIKQATSPSYEFPEPVLLSVLEVLTAEYPKPLPPVDLCFLHELYHRGSLWKRSCLKLAARQAGTSGSARRFLDNYLQGICKEADECDVILVFELAPVLCRGMPPNALRPVLDKFLGEAHAELANFRWKEPSKVSLETDAEPKYMFVRQLECVQAALECDKIHEANRTLLSQLLERYFEVLSDDSPAWDAYVRACVQLPAAPLERTTSPGGWWEVTGEALRKACAVRCAVAASCARALTPRPLVWLNDIIDAVAHHYSEHEYSVHCMVPALQAAAARADGGSTREWFLQLLARSQVAFNETEDTSTQLYLMDVFTCAVLVFSGLWALVRGGAGAGAGGGGGDSRRARAERAELLPPAARALLARPGWGACALQLIEWTWHTRDVLRDPPAARACQRALLALRHTEPFVKHNIWKRLDFDNNPTDGDE